MKNRTKKILIFFTICIVGFLLILIINNKKYFYKDFEKPLLQIPVMSDIHINNGRVNGFLQRYRFTKVLKEYKKLAPNYDAIAFVGDITHNGYVSQYETFVKIVNRYTYKKSEKLFTIGNHEYFEGRFNPELGLTDQILKDRFIKETGTPGIYYDKWVKGYHFIVLGGEESRITNESNGDKAIISEEQYKWLEDIISIDVNKNKPIFIFLHQPIDNTVYGSATLGDGLDDRLRNILKQYPQAIMFSGHSHYPLENDKSVYQDVFSVANTGSLFTTCDDSYGEEIVIGQFLQGLLVNVYVDRVEIKARQFSDNKWIKTTTIKLEK